MAREITLPKDVRTFVKTGKGTLLARSGFHFARGDVLKVSDPVTMHYDHCDKAAVEVLEPELDQPYFMLVSEMGMSEFLN